MAVDFDHDFGSLEQRYTRLGQIDAAKLARDARATVASSEAEILPNMTGVVLTDNAPLKSEKHYKPPVEIEWQFEPGGDTRLGYACDQLVFDWANNPHHLRIDGGPVSGQHKEGVGNLAKKAPARVKLAVTAGEMILWVDGEERARWAGDFSRVNQQVSIRKDGGDPLKVLQVSVRKLR